MPPQLGVKPELASRGPQDRSLFLQVLTTKVIGREAGGVKRRARQGHLQVGVRED